MVNKGIKKGKFGLARWRRGAVSFLLTAALTVVNIGGQVGTVLAADYYDSKVFELESRNVYFAIREALDGGERISSGDIEFTNGKSAAYRALFYGENLKAGERLTLNDQLESNLLEFFPEHEEDMDAELRFFVRLPEDADSEYCLTGEEQIILLYVNNTDETLKCSVSADGRKGKSVIIKGYQEAYGEEEVDLASVDIKQEETSEAPELTGGAESQEQGESIEPQGDAVEGTDPQGDAVESTDPDVEETASVEGTTSGKGEESQDDAAEEPAETSVEDSEAETAEESASGEENVTEEPDHPKEDAAEESESVTASVSRHNAPMVAVSEGDGAKAESATETKKKHEADTITDAGKDSGKDNAVSVPEDAEAGEADSPEEGAIETGTADDEEAGNTETGTADGKEAGSTEAGTADGEEAVSTEAGTADGEEAGSTEAGTADGEEAGSTEAGTADGEEAGSTEAGTADGEEAGSDDTGTVGTGKEDTVPVQDTATQSDAQKVNPEDQEDSDAAQTIKTGKYPLVGINGCSTAKAYVTDIKGLGVDLDQMDAGFFWEQEMSDGVTVTLVADAAASAILTRNTTAEITQVDDSFKEAVSLSAGLKPDTMVLYDVTLYDEEGGQIDSAEWAGKVRFSFTGQKIEEITAREEVINIIHVPVMGDASDLGDLQIELLDSVDLADGEGVQEISGNTESFSVVGCGAPVEGSVEIETFDFGNGRYGAVIGTDNSKRIAYCISPNMDYPLEKTTGGILHKEYYESNLLGEPISSFFPDVVYTEDSVLTAAIIADLGYSGNSDGDCTEFRTKGMSDYEIWEQTGHAIWWALNQEYYSLEEISKAPDSMYELSKVLYAKSLAIKDSYPDETPTISSGSGPLVFRFDRDLDRWVTNYVKIDSNQPKIVIKIPAGLRAECYDFDTNSYILQPELESCTIESGTNVRFQSETEPAGGEISFSAFAYGLELGEHCKLYKPYYQPETADADKIYQNLLTLDYQGKMVSDTENAEYTVDSKLPPQDDLPEPTPEPAPEVQPTPEPAPEVQPTPEPAPEVQPTPEPAPEVQPTPEPAPEVQPTPDSTPDPAPEVQPAPESAPTEDSPSAQNRPPIGNSSGNGGTSGGSSTSPSGPGRSGPVTGGPGAISIEEVEVPLASLPFQPDTTMIPDEDVPLAPLPKTGEAHQNREVLFILSGLMMAICTLISRKKNKAR